MKGESWTVRTTLGEEDTTTLVADYKAGMRIAELAQKYGVNRKTVIRRLERQGLKRTVNAFTPEKAERAVELYLGGMTLVEAADATNSNSRSVSLALAERGIPRRRRGVRAHITG